MNVAPARRTAFATLLRVATADAWASSLLSAPRYDKLTSADHALAQELTLGVLRWQLQLDFLLERFAHRNLSRLDIEVIIALRMGLYQLRFLTRIAPHAAINEAVKLVREHGKKSAAPFVNAVLRAAQRAGNDEIGQMIQAITDPLQRLSVETSHPVWLLQRWHERMGEVTARELAMANNVVPRAAFRFNAMRAAPEQARAWLATHDIAIRDSVLVPHAAIITRGSLSANAEPVQEGWLYFQDEASQLVAHLAAVSRQAAAAPGRVLDLCAAPGSKTTLLAALLPENTRIVACDLHHHRLLTMKRLAARNGITKLNLLQCDARALLPFSCPFDVVLLDAPCSGLGTLQRHPEIKWRAKSDSIAELAARQKQTLVNAAQFLRPGGVLTYAVCSPEPEEGEEVIAWFRQQQHEYRDITRERLQECGIDPTGLLTTTFGARTFTHRHGTESFFICVLWKRR